jgi:alpha-mannosidase
MATTIHLVSHTHWDREWYLTFQQFRLKLVNLIDNLLDLLAEDPNFRYFMLDGQTIVLDDYLQIRPEREQELCEHIRNGRLLIGPWHILPDEFLVSPEAIIRNLLQGERTSRRFGSKMKVGYIPDTFGHIGQMPQILQGFGLQAASLQRGLSDQPCEFWWQSPDGSRVFMAYLRDGYGNAALLPAADPQTFTAEVERLAGSLEPYSSSGHVLLMHGTDHTQPPPQTSQAVAYAQGHLQGAQLIHDTLPNALAAMQQALQEQGKALITVEGELRECKRHHLLPGVLSTRMWIKQRNHACETLLEKWAEPFSTFAGIFAAQAEPSQASLSQIPGGREGMQERRLRHPEPILRYAWRVLLECQPHDSICGTSIDAVHEEMRSRFDQVEQIGEEIIRQSLESLAENIRTESPFPAAMSAIVVFNPLQDDRSEPVELSIPLASGSTEYEIVDEEGQRAPSQFGEIEENELAYLVLNREELMALLGGVQDGTLNNLGPVQDMSIQDVRFKRQNSVQFIYAVLSERGDPNQEALAQGMMEIMQAFGDPTVEKFILQVSVRSIRIRFLARQAPGLGYRSFWVRSPETPTRYPRRPEGKATLQAFTLMTASPTPSSACRSRLPMALCA